jgi:2-methylcitrate dehydratase PrpD
MSMTEKIAQFCAETQFADLSEQAVEKAKMAIADTYGVIFTGVHEEVTKILVEWIQDKQGTNREATVIGHPFQTSVSEAAFLHGVMGHAIDFDDVHSSLRGHPSVVILPVVLAVGERLQSRGKDMILAFVLGTEVMIRLSHFLNPSHYLKGWHSTATLGVIGAAVATGKLHGFDQKKMQRVLGLSSTMASGMRLNFGTMTKPFHVGYAAKNGIEAAELVQLGLTANEYIFDSDINVLRLYGDEQADPQLSANWGSPWEIEAPGFNIKRYPCCYATHRAADAMENIIQKHPFNLQEVEKIECFTPIGSMAPVIYNRPNTGLEGKFSMQYVLAAMLVDGHVNIGSFTDEQVNRTIIQQLLPRIEASETMDIKENRDQGDLGYIELNIHLKSGRTLQERVHYARGSFRNPLTKEQLYEKFSDCLKQSDCSDHKNKFEIIMKLEQIENTASLF